MATDSSNQLDPELLQSFPDIPPFPANIPTAPLLRLSLPALRQSNAESDRLWSASTNLGFFYLDLRGDALGEQLLSDSTELFDLGEKLFNLGSEELQKYDYSEHGSYFGYKGFAKGVVDKEGRRDGNEFYNVCPPFSPPQFRVVTSHPTYET